MDCPINTKLEREYSRLLEISFQLQQRVCRRRTRTSRLRKYADRVSDLYNNAPCGYHSLDEDGVYVEINDTELNWLGLTREEVIGRLRFSDILKPEQRPFFEETYRYFVAEGSIRDVEYQLQSKDGTTRRVLLSASASRDSEGRFVMSRATLYDITDRRRAKNWLSARKRSLLALSVLVQSVLL
jgi:PAS domain S-box-containing protein